jgi:hypothetical protein
MIAPVSSANTGAITGSLDCNGNVSWTLSQTGYSAPFTVSESDTGKSTSGTFPQPITPWVVSGTFTIPTSFTSDTVTGTIGFSTGTQTFTVTVNRPANCTPPPTVADNYTPGYWKTHDSATQALLPLSLGGFSVTSSSTASSILSEMGCGHDGALNCMAGMLLAAELNLAQGGSTCIVTNGDIGDANALLTKYAYSGPGKSYTLSSSDQTLAMSLHDALSNYNIDGIPTC